MASCKMLIGWFELNGSVVAGAEHPRQNRHQPRDRDFLPAHDAVKRRLGKPKLGCDPRLTDAMRSAIELDHLAEPGPLWFRVHRDFRLGSICESKGGKLSGASRRYRAGASVP